MPQPAAKAAVAKAPDPPKAAKQRSPKKVAHPSKKKPPGKKKPKGKKRR
jgi:hypothetical protein